MDTAPTCRVELVFKDKEDRTARTAFHLPFSTPATTAINKGISVANAILGASNAVFVGVKVFYKAVERNPGVAGSESDVNRMLALFYSNASGYEAIYIPSPKGSTLEDTGPYKGIRANRLAPELLPFTSTPPVALAGTSTPEGEAFPQAFEVGGLVK